MNKNARPLEQQNQVAMNKNTNPLERQSPVTMNKNASPLGLQSLVGPMARMFRFSPQAVGLRR